MKPGSSGAKEYIENFKNEKNQKDLDLRDYFAAKAMQNFSWIGENDNECAVSCYEIADAMMEARNGSQ
jgi:hypothetical protein